MKVIYKYRLGVDGQTTAIKCKFSKLLTVQTQYGWPHVWMEIDDDMPEVEVVFVAIGTGWELPKHELMYAGTAQDECGYVWHYYYTWGTRALNFPEIYTPTLS